MRTALTLLLCIACHGALAADDVPVPIYDDAAQALPADSGQEQGQESGEDAPSRVARLGYIGGKVVMAPAGTDEWTDALLNRPLTTGDRLWVDAGGKSELQVGSSSIYLDAESGFSFLDLGDERLHMSLTDGSATIRVRRKLENESIQVETPNATVTLLHPGEYHIEIAEDGAATVVSTRSGESLVEGEKGTFTVRADERGIFRGTESLNADVGRLGPRTAFQDWANDRERRDDESASAKYVSRDVIGYEDLDRNGTWVSEPEYGYVWRPSYVVAGWAPYRFGRWVWVSPWGWSWVDNSPWGFAPFHYGRWAYVRSNWCWVPGPRHIRPVYAPALVAWVGGSGPRVSVSFGSGVGWFPLGPREVYVPGYWHSRRYIRNVNVSNTIIINNTYVNNVYAGRGGHHDYRYGRSTRAVTIVTRDRFIGGRPIDGHFVRTSDADLRRWGHVGRAPAIAPDRSSVLAAQHAVQRPPMRQLIRPEHLDARRDNGQFLARRTPPQRVSFEAERRAIEANQGRPVDRSQIVRPTLARADRVRPDQDRSGRPVRSGFAEREDRAGSNEIVRERYSNDRPQWARQRGVTPPGNDSAANAGIDDTNRNLRDRPKGESRVIRPTDDAPRRLQPESARTESSAQESQERGGSAEPRRVWSSEHSVNRRPPREDRGNDRPARSEPPQRVERSPVVEPSQPQYTAPREQSRFTPRSEPRPEPRSEARPRESAPERYSPPQRVERSAPQRREQSRPQQQDSDGGRQNRSFSERSNK